MEIAGSRVARKFEDEGRVQVTSRNRKGLQEMLEDELETLKEKSGKGHRLRVELVPRQDSKLCGELRDNVIYVYELSEQDAIVTLRHEFIDFLVSQAVESYRELANTLIRLKNRDAYEKKEEIVEGVRKLLD